MELDYIIIAGAPRSGTTSLFKYLSDHSSICGSDLKQTLFFLDLEYKDIPSKPMYHYSEGIEAFDNFFKNHQEGQIKLEATPDYLYSNNTPKAIYDSLKKVHLIFILRNPVDRFRSLFFHGKSTGYVDKNIDFDEFITQSFAKEADNYGSKMLGTGNYFKFLQPFLSLFNRDQISILFLEEMEKDPKLVLTKLCQALKLDATIYDSYQFVQHNQKQEVRNEAVFQTYKKLRSFFLKLTMQSELLGKILELPKQLISSFYQKMNTKEITPDNSISLAEKNILRLQDFYSEDVTLLEEFLNKKTPWGIKTSSNVQ